jgi:cysteine-rich repeat protein
MDAALAACSSAGSDDTVPPAYGDGVKEGSEQCDDGNKVAGDGCSATCMTESAAGGTCDSPFALAPMNVSNNLSPELTGSSYMLHNAMAGAAGAFSPGKRANGAPF